MTKSSPPPSTRSLDSSGLLIRAEGLEIGHGREPILPPITFAVRAGEVWMLTGANGSGKSTLLRTVLGLIRPIRGVVTRFGHVGYVPQRATIDPRVPGRVQDLVALGLDAGWSVARPWTPRPRRAAVERALELSRCGALRARQLRDLSEGQRQRVLIARALASGPQILVLDEPTSAMDQSSASHVLELLAELRTALGLGILVVSHDVPAITRVATHAIVLDPRLTTVPVGSIAALEADPAAGLVIPTRPSLTAAAAGGA